MSQTKRVREKKDVLMELVLLPFLPFLLVFMVGFACFEVVKELFKRRPV